MLLFVYMYMYIDLLKLKAYKLFENSDADLSWLLFWRSQLVFSQCLTNAEAFCLESVIVPSLILNGRFDCCGSPLIFLIKSRGSFELVFAFTFEQNLSHPYLLAYLNAYCASFLACLHRFLTVYFEIAFFFLDFPLSLWQLCTYLTTKEPQLY